MLSPGFSQSISIDTMLLCWDCWAMGIYASSIVTTGGLGSVTPGMPAAIAA